MVTFNHLIWKIFQNIIFDQVNALLLSIRDFFKNIKTIWTVEWYIEWQTAYHSLNHHVKNMLYFYECVQYITQLILTNSSRVLSE